MSIEPKDLEEVNKALTELREEVQKSAPDQEKIGKLEAALDKYEEANQTITKQLGAVLAKAEEDAETAKALGVSLDEYKQRIQDLEAAGSERTNKDVDLKDSAEWKETNNFFTSGAQRTDYEAKARELVEKQLLRTDTNVSAGFLLVPVIADEILREIEEVDPMRSVCRVRRMANKSLEQPVRDTIPTATYEGEAESGDDDTSTYRLEQITPFRQTVTVPTTMDMLMDAAFDMETEIFSDVATSFAQGEGINFISGDAVKKPQGFLADVRITAEARETTASLTLDFDAVRQLPGDLKVGYNPTYLFNQKILALLRVLKGSDGQYLWQPAISERASATIDGIPYVIMPSMPGFASGSTLIAGEFPVACGDFRRGYHIFDRTDMSVVRDEVTRKRQAVIEWTFNRWNTGQVMIPEAIKVIRVKS